jgi:hypothetical protein
MPRRKLTASVQVGLRLSERLRKRLEVEAKRRGLSLNGELVRRLEESLEKQVIDDLIKDAALFTGEIMAEGINKVLEAVNRPDLVMRRGDFVQIFETKYSRRTETAEPGAEPVEVERVSEPKGGGTA